MFRILLLLIIIVPAAEIALLILFGQAIGLWPTIGLILLTGVLGAWLAKREGLQTIRLAQLEVEQGRVPSDMLLDGICILIGGVVLLTPGFITDALGFFLLIPQTRGIAKGFILKLFNKMARNGSFVFISRR
ncbi:membrane protein FxsA [Halalkalibacterium halodurans]|uniref:BH3162 protein n=1 Tax=Halalkalibacterium halodurans (strain ATCC BAA-125 / DSM 18197 / FERM 7344 / JCM 9153 / C-125) TaxID=272558 RepID=Q9K845_HALH5|nr:FxsA family protein [Halalkalibacterium halodurans]MDY7223695.1 FxsA family protein [Halalkalibacterium halodurans]MDY7242916.1 FxsA family protein [Halalkalibacterium halodurans]MED4082144.1 membrane protein FxsA [Halalkalibacterium halodurans]MED4084278.1 membrane protein FxsA [Halalkalibacterium halodurans]MED4103587.1 membrane protein FxsA [Halalkalibacterium halodurans]